jgi:quaternary ammonium compound-resistance protein SugE
LAWLFLGLAGLCEVGFTTAMKYADGFTKLAPSLIFVVLYIASAILLAQAVRTLPLGTAYAVWTGIGAVGTAIIGIIVFGDAATAARMFFLALIVVGIVGLKAVSS